MRFIKVLAIVAIGFQLGACAQFKEFGSEVKAIAGKLSTTSVPVKAVLAAETAFDGIERVAEQYLRLPICKISITKACRDPSVTEPLATAIGDGRNARDALDQFMDAHPGQLGPSGLYDALISATGGLKKILKDSGYTS